MNNNLDKSIERILENGEKVSWFGKPVFLPYILNSFFPVLIPVLLGSFIIKKGLSAEANAECVVDGITKSGSDCGMGFFTAVHIGEIIIGVGLLLLLGIIISALVNSYAVTDRRVILRSGLIGADIESVYFDKLKDISVVVGLVGKMFNTGSVILNTGDTETYTDKDGHTSTTLVTKNLLSIKNPYDVYKQLQTILNDRKNAQYSGRKDFEDNKEGYKEFVQQTEEFKKEI